MKPIRHLSFLRPIEKKKINELGEPGKCKVVSLKGQKTCQIVTCADRDNKTALAPCTPDGKAFFDVAAFELMKSSRGRILFDKLKSTCQQLSKAEFARLTARGDV